MLDRTGFERFQANRMPVPDLRGNLQIFDQVEMLPCEGTFFAVFIRIP
jgi:hypothetical protein